MKEKREVVTSDNVIFDEEKIRQRQGTELETSTTEGTPEKQEESSSESDEEEENWTTGDSAEETNNENGTQPSEEPGRRILRDRRTLQPPPRLKDCVLDSRRGGKSAKVAMIGETEDITAFPAVPSTSQNVVQAVEHMSTSTNQQIRPDLNIPDTPRKQRLKQRIIHLEDIAKRRRLRCNALYASRRRLKKKVKDVSRMLSELKDKRLINQEEVNLLEVCNVSAAALIKRMVKKTKQYSAELRKFALTLHFYSPKAYSYIRSTFNTCLPHPSTLRKWYQSIDAGPGFTAEAFKVMSQKAKTSDKKILCNLVIDEMSIRQIKEYDGNIVHGYVDFGAEFDEPGDLSVPCTQSLVFLLVAINEPWKLPVGYFLVNGLTGEQRANLVKMCLSNCHDAGIEVASMTFDGCPSNIAMSRELGCLFEHQYQGQLKTSFPHPTTSEPVSIFLDPCHMIKLIRNTLENKKVLQDSNGGFIKWQYFVDLNTLQKNEMFHLANKLTTRHIDFKNQKMKVKLAVQLLSGSVARAIEYCDKELQILNFKNSEATVQFINTINNLFDIMNSRKFPGIDFKAPINEKNETKYLTFLEKTEVYLKHLAVPGDEQKLITSRNKTGFLGMCVCMNSLKDLYQRLVKEEKILKFIPMYKVSQDHLEIFFSVVRSHGGFNNNPSALQFKAIYKKLLVHMELKQSFKGNCVPLEHITLLTCSSSADHINLTTKGYRSNSQIDMVNVQSLANFEEEPANFSIDLTKVSQQVVSYIAGYVVRYLLLKLDCTDCIQALVASKTQSHHSFIVFKDRGSLVYPSEDVVKICNTTESVVKSNIDAKKPIDRDPKSMVMKALKLFIGSDVFNVLYGHSFEQEACSNHLVHLLRAVIQKYVDIRVKYFLKSNMTETKRQLYNKLTLFKGQ
ncbi:unnamed protein product [Arctia plantaginis]|uniref:DNA transposase THAP9 n=1 Tax=Arctia plantaginis TaxID=874455 RepID=A0A8S1AAZ6_ARCPL|nr:unnamed protein product [Arctia plantaginis]